MPYLAADIFFVLTTFKLWFNLILSTNLSHRNLRTSQIDMMYLSQFLVIREFHYVLWAVLSIKYPNKSNKLTFYCVSPNICIYLRLCIYLGPLKDISTYYITPLSSCTEPIRKQMFPFILAPEGLIIKMRERNKSCWPIPWFTLIFVTTDYLSLKIRRIHIPITDIYAWLFSLRSNTSEVFLALKTVFLKLMHAVRMGYFSENTSRT